jgi:hypothetical protein
VDKYPVNCSKKREQCVLRIVTEVENIQMQIVKKRGLVDVGSLLQILPK